MRVYLDDACFDGVHVRRLQKSCSFSSYNMLVMGRLTQCWSQVNVPSVRLVSSPHFALSSPRHFSSQSSNDDDESDSDAAAKYCQLYERLVTHSQASAAALPSPSFTSALSSQTSRPVDASLSHVSDLGRVKMVDVGEKSETLRVAVASGRVQLSSTAFQLVAENRLMKGDVLSTSQLAGIMAAKQTSQLIPLCHHILLTSVDMTVTLDPGSLSVVIECTVKSHGQTGAEMESLTGVSVAALTIYDMCKSVSHDIIISDIQLVSKTGGKSDFHR